MGPGKHTQGQDVEMHTGPTTISFTKEDKMGKLTRSVLLAVGIGWIALGGVVHAKELNWWSHWAIEDNKKAVLFEVKKRFEAKHPGDTVTITFYEKANMWPILRAAFTAGSGFPDLFHFDSDAIEMIGAGWLADMSTAIRWENIEPYGTATWELPGPGGKMGRWAIPLEASSDEIYFNKKMFRQLGITVPPRYAFTQDEFKEVVAKCAKAGYAAFSTGAADREWAAMFMPNMLLLSKLGGAEMKRLARGELSWKDPRVIEVFRYYGELINLGAYSKTLSSMTLAEGHRYLHTEQKACMFPFTSAYPGRAFVAPEKGGQPADFDLGMLNYPLMKDGKGHYEKYLGATGGSVAVAAKSPNLALALEVANTIADPQIGNMWMAKTGVQTGIKTDVAKIDSPIKWYFEEFAKVNKNTKWVDFWTLGVKLLMKPGMWDEYVATVNQGLPNKVVNADQALNRLEAARLKFK
jgi:multiple sugar transport system substrate-binding protein